LRPRIANALPGIVALWGAGVLVLSIRYLGGWRVVRRMDRSARPLLDADVSSRLARLLRRMRVTRPVRLLESAMVEVPTVVGWLRPAILLPAATIAGLSPEQLEAILAHELAHVRRHDYLASLLQSAVETVLFYHPAVWWVSHRMRVERELCCDDEAVAACGNPIEYARALAGLEALRPAPRLAPAATGGPLFERIARLVAAPSGQGLRATRAAAALLGGAALVLALTGVTSLRAQATASPSETEATKKPAPSAKPVAAPAADAKRARPAPAASRTGGASIAKDEPASSRPVPVERLIELAGAGVTPEYVDEMAALGYPSLSWDQLIQLRSQGVGPEYVRGLAAAGYAHLTPDQLVSLRSQGVSPDFVKDLAAQGMKDLSLSDLLSLRSQGVSPEYVRDLRAAGYADLSVTDLVGARSNGVSPEDAAALRGMGYTDLSLSRLVGMRSMGVNAEYVRGLQAQGYTGLSAPLLIGLRNQGVSIEYIREMKELGYTGLVPGELIELRSHGVTPEYVRELKDAGYDRLTTRELIELRSRGVDPALLKRLKARGEGSR
jgi:beta-lactamase regulating signal transducer with metallopeptidase domain